MTYIRLDIKIGGDGGTAAEIDCVVLDHWPTLLPLNIDTVCVARDDFVP